MNHHTRKLEKQSDCKAKWFLDDTFNVVDVLDEKFLKDQEATD